MVRTWWPWQCVDEIAAACKIDKSTASEHLRRLHEGGMIGKKYRVWSRSAARDVRASAMLRTIDLLWDASEKRLLDNLPIVQQSGGGGKCGVVGCLLADGG